MVERVPDGLLDRAVIEHDRGLVSTPREILVEDWLGARASNGLFFRARLVGDVALDPEQRSDGSERDPCALGVRRKGFEVVAPGVSLMWTSR
jgi:hypothetical protein